MGLPVSQALPHPGYSPAQVLNDIALIRLELPVEFSNNVRPACLPTDDSEDYVEKRAVVAGWGSTSFGKLSKTHPCVLFVPTLAGSKRN